MKHLVVLALLALPVTAGAQTVVTLAESATRDLAQDRLSINLRIEATGPTAAAAQGDVNRRMEIALARAKTVPAVRVETGSAWANEERPNNQPRRWRANASLSLSSGDFPTLLALTGALQESGLVVAGMNFDLTANAARGAQDALTHEALQRLQARAALVAEALGQRVGTIRHIRIGQPGSDASPVPRFAMRAAMAGAPDMQAPVAEPGRTTLRIDVEADIVLAPK